MNFDRRQCLKLFLGSGLTLSSWLTLSTPANGRIKVKALVLSCIDFRFVTMIHHFLEQQNLTGQYDWLSLAGASLVLSDFPSAADSQSFWEQLDLSVQLHQIETVMIIDHQDCGAYATKIDRQLSQNPAQEQQTHRQYLHQAYRAIVQRYPNLQVQLYFAYLNGDIKNISIT